MIIFTNLLLKTEKVTIAFTSLDGIAELLLQLIKITDLVTLGRIHIFMTGHVLHLP